MQSVRLPFNYCTLLKALSLNLELQDRAAPAVWESIPQFVCKVRPQLLETSI